MASYIEYKSDKGKNCVTCSLRAMDLLMVYTGGITRQQNNMLRDDVSMSSGVK